MNQEEIIGFEALWESMHKCKKGVMWKGSVAHFVLNGMEETIKLERELTTGTYKARKTTKFRITSPKPRDIVSISFRDRVYQRSLNDNAIYPEMTKSFIRDNCACQKRKGTDDARERFRCFLQRAYRKYGLDFSIGQCDIHGYYQHMDHDAAKQKFRKHLDDDTYERSLAVLDDQYDGDVGYNPGSQMIQIAGIAFLDDIDHFIKEELRIKMYLRYMDDFVLIHPDAEYLAECMKRLGEKLAEKGLEYNPKKTQITSARKPVRFLGFDWKLTETGKVIQILDPAKVKKEQQKLRKLVAKAKRGETTKAKVDECFSAWKNHAGKGNATKMLARMDAYYKNLWRCDNDNQQNNRGHKQEPGERKPLGNGSGAGSND